MPNCEKYKFELKKPCSCTKCSFHINRESSFNCMKHYLLTEGTSWKNITEAFSALNVSRGEFRKNVDNALDESRVAKLDEVIGRGNEFEYVPDSDICVVCGKDCSKKILKFNGISYCSQACLKKLPVKVASLMNRLGIDEYTLLYA